MGLLDKLKKGAKKAGEGYSKVRKGYESYKAKEPERLKRQNLVLSQKVSIAKKQAQLNKLRQSPMGGMGLGGLGVNPLNQKSPWDMPSTKKKKPKRRRPKRVEYY